MAEAPKLYKDADSRLSGFFGQVSHPTMPLQRTYCIFCGKPWGYCSTDSSQNVAPERIVVTCDDCDVLMLKFNAQTVPQHVLDAFGLIQEPRELPKEDSNVLV